MEVGVAVRYRRMKKGRESGAAKGLEVYSGLTDSRRCPYAVRAYPAKVAVVVDV